MLSAASHPRPGGTRTQYALTWSVQRRVKFTRFQTHKAPSASAVFSHAPPQDDCSLRWTGCLKTATEDTAAPQVPHPFWRQLLTSVSPTPLPDVCTGVDGMEIWACCRPWSNLWRPIASPRNMKRKKCYCCCDLAPMTEACERAAAVEVCKVCGSCRAVQGWIVSISAININTHIRPFINTNTYTSSSAAVCAYTPIIDLESPVPHLRCLPTQWRHEGRSAEVYASPRSKTRRALQLRD